jgi:hypothetical protein
MAEGVDSPREEDAGGGYCPERGVHALAREIHAQAHGAHVPARAMQEADGRWQMARKVLCCI